MNRITRILTSAAIIIFTLGAFVLIYLKNAMEIGPGLIGAAPCMSAACICQAIRYWSIDRKWTLMMVLFAVAMVVVAIYFAFI